jgi:hypothetical protein
MCVCDNECLPNQVGCDPIQPGLVTCDGPDENGCLFWGPPVFCEVGQVCKRDVGPAEVPACVDYTPPLCADINECDFVGQKKCVSDSQYRECFARAEDGCLRLDCGS